TGPQGTEGRGGAAALSGLAGPFFGHDAYPGKVLWPSPWPEGIEQRTPGRFIQTGGRPLAGGGCAAGGVRGDSDLPGQTSPGSAPACAAGGASPRPHSARRGDPAPELAPGLLPA